MRKRDWVGKRDLEGERERHWGRVCVCVRLSKCVHLCVIRRLRFRDTGGRRA